MSKNFNPLTDEQHLDAPQNITISPFYFTFHALLRAQNNQPENCSPADRFAP